MTLEMIILWIALVALATKLHTYPEPEVSLA